MKLHERERSKGQSGRASDDDDNGWEMWQQKRTKSQVGCLNRVCETKSGRGEKFEKWWWEEGDFKQVGGGGGVEWEVASQRRARGNASARQQPLG